MTASEAHILESLTERSITTPDLVAVRLAGQPVTYGELAADLRQQAPGTDEPEGAEYTALIAALMGHLPYRMRSASPAEDLKVVAAAIGWLTEVWAPATGTADLRATG